jgi:Patatin-like phospholipase
MSDLPGKDQFPREVYPAELRAIRDRRKVWGLESRPELEQAATAESGASPNPEHGAAGLAFSGGGIRSATFNLGILQVLAKRGLLKWFDYLSTVSGGGYIGSSLTCALQFEDPSVQQPGHSYVHRRGEEEPPLIKHLRSGGDYLAPGGLLNKLKIPAVLMRGVVINLLVILPFLAGLAIFTAWLYPHLLDRSWDVSLFRFDLTLPWPETANPTASGSQPEGTLNFFIFFPWALLAFGLWILLFPLIATLTPHARYKWRSLYEASFSVLLLFVLGLPLVEGAPALLRWINDALESTKTDDLLAAITACLVALVPTLSRMMSSGDDKPGWTAQLASWGRGLVVAVLGPAIVLFIYLRLTRALYPETTDSHPLAEPAAMLIAAIVSLVLFLGGRLLVDINESGMHRFYRDRLSKAYLARPSDLSHQDELEMSQLDIARSGAPYHLVNTSLNVQGTHEPELQGRGCDFFVFSPQWTGSFATGYRPTKDVEHANSDMNLGTSLAISGAAASPYMGVFSSKLRAFLLTLLNVRLDYWLQNPRFGPNPSALGILRTVSRLAYRVGPFYLLLELLGVLRASSRNVNLSDGGHIENLALYELLRRRAKFIVCSDAGCDPLLENSSLGMVTAYARMDQGIQIDWTGLERIKLRPDGTSAAQWAVGRIVYGDATEKGWILFVKSSVCGDEPPDITAYRAKHRTFPHESTGDQFFDQDQFEAYRALGYHIADKMVAIGGSDGELESWFEKLATAAGRKGEGGEGPSDGPSVEATSPV